MIEETSTVVNDIDSDKNDNNTSYMRPNILLTGLRRSGKTSIQRVIFTKMQPSQTQFLKSTPHLTINQFSCGSFINFQVQELPGQLHVFPSLQFPNSDGTHNGSSSLYDDDNTTHLISDGYDMKRLLKRCNAVVYIIDAQDDYSQSVSSLNMIIQSGRRVNPRLRYEVFIHKVDQLLEEAKIETQRDIHNQVRDYFADVKGGTDSCPLTSFGSNPNAQNNILINFHLTSIFDHSIFEAFSKVIQKLIPQFNHLEDLLNYLISASNMEQAFLFDIQTKISIATDSSPSDMQIYELCCNMIDLLINMSEIYGQSNDNVTQTIEDDDDNESIMNGIHESMNSYSNSSPSTTFMGNSFPSIIVTTDEPSSNVFDSMSSSVIKLTGGRALYFKGINHHLALICILHEKALTKEAIIEYNVNQLKTSILELFHLTHQISASLAAL